MKKIIALSFVLSFILMTTTPLITIAAPFVVSKTYVDYEWGYTVIEKWSDGYIEEYDVFYLKF